MLTLQLSSAAADDLTQAMRFYREQAGEKLAGLYLTEFERVAAILCEFPELGTPLSVGRRVFPLRRFPYSVFYRRHDHFLRVIAVVHQRRHPVVSQGRH
ncbi:MAG: type II toxin-antitoxin system RelE/ParE family toxin [Pseudomonadota bacterium]|nr:type II toxin-antitoxin system RelE/ParE family toxin [Pseudomonadota bacterium]